MIEPKRCVGEADELCSYVFVADIISAVEFCHDGEYLATGDKGGRVVLFERNNDPRVCVCEYNHVVVVLAHVCLQSAEYRFYTEFQSHEPEFDYLKSLEIEEKINQIKWLKRQSVRSVLSLCRSCSFPPRAQAAHMLLTTNDKTVKLWKVVEKQSVVDRSLLGSMSRACIPIIWCAVPLSLQPSRQSASSIKGPKRMESHVDCRSDVPLSPQPDSHDVHRVKKVFANAHTYHINSISPNSDGETFLSADDLRINVWNLGVSNQSFNILDIKPANMEELTEVSFPCCQAH